LPKNIKEKAGKFAEILGEKFEEGVEEIKKRKEIKEYDKAKKEYKEDQELKFKRAKKQQSAEYKAEQKAKAQAAKLELKEAKSEKDRPRIYRAFQKYSTYVSDSELGRYKSRYGASSYDELPVEALRAIAIEGRRKKELIEKAQKVAEQQRKLKLLKAKQDFKTMKQLAPAETRQRRGYLDLLSKQTSFNIEQLARQKAEARARDLENQRARQIRDIQRRQQRKIQLQEASRRAFTTEPGEGITPFFTDGIPNPEPTTSKMLKFV
jgi:hypothetical protein